MPYLEREGEEKGDGDNKGKRTDISYILLISYI